MIVARFVAPVSSLPEGTYDSTSFPEESVLAVSWQALCSSTLSCSTPLRDGILWVRESKHEQVSDCSLKASHSAGNRDLVLASISINV